MPDFVITTAFKGRDAGISSSLKRMTSNADRFGNRSQRAFRRASTSALSFKKIIGGILGAQLIRAGAMRLQQGIRSVAEEFVSFDHAVTSAAAKFPEKIKRGTKAFEDLGKAARDVGATTEFTPAEAAKGLELFAMAGFKAVNAMKALPSVVDLATATNSEFALAADAASDALGSFGMFSDDAAIQQKNLQRITDVFTRTVIGANTTLEQLFLTMQDSGPAIALTGSNVETFGGLLVGLANAGIKGTKAGTTLKNAFLRLAKPPSEAAKALKKLNITTRETNGDMRDIIDILGDVEKALKNKGTAERAAALDAIFSKRAVSGMSAVLKLGTDKLREYREGMVNAGGTARNVSEEMRKSLQNRFAKLKSTALDLGLRFVDAFSSKLPGAVDATIKAIRGVNVDQIIEDVKNFALFIKDMWVGLKKAKPFILGVAAAFVTLKAAMAGIAITQFAAGIGLAVTPLGAIALAIGGVVAAGIVLYENWDDLGRAISWLWEDIKEIFTSIKEHPLFAFLATAFNPLMAAPALIAKYWEPLGTFFSRLWEGIVEVFEKGTVTKLKALFFDTLGWIKREVGKVIDWFGGVFKAIGGVASSVVNALSFTGEEIAARNKTERVAPERTAPNQAAVEGAAGFWEGKITLAGAPEGSIFDMKSAGGAPQIKTDVEAVNP
jgi:TP901 family phage tail tape measure protein